MVIFESGTFLTGESALSVLCEDSLAGEVTKTFREVYGVRVISVEDYIPGSLCQSRGRFFFWHTKAVISIIHAQRFG